MSVWKSQKKLPWSDAKKLIGLEYLFKPSELNKMATTIDALEAASLAIDAAIEKKKQQRINLRGVISMADLRQAALKEDIEDIYKYNSGCTLKWTKTKVYDYTTYASRLCDRFRAMPRDDCWYQRIMYDQYCDGDITVVVWNQSILQWEEGIGLMPDDFNSELIRIIILPEP